MMADRQVVAVISALWRSQDSWRRLEAGPGAYCCPLEGRSSGTGDLLLFPSCPRPIQMVAALLGESGWARIEILGWPGRKPDGWCERGDGSGISIRNMDGYESAFRWGAGQGPLAGRPGHRRGIWRKIFG